HGEALALGRQHLQRLAAVDGRGGRGRVGLARAGGQKGHGRESGHGGEEVSAFHAAMVVPDQLLKMACVIRSVAAAISRNSPLTLTHWWPRGAAYSCGCCWWTT